MRPRGAQRSGGAALPLSSPGGVLGGASLRGLRPGTTPHGRRRGLPASGRDGSKAARARLDKVRRGRDVFLPDAALQARGAAAATQERRLFPVACKRLILIEVPSSAYHGGMLIVGN